MPKLNVVSLFMSCLIVCLLLPVIVMSSRFEDQKNFFYHDPFTGTPPTGSTSSHGITPVSPHHGSTTPSHTPSHGSTPKCGTPPSQSGGHHGGGSGYHHSPPTSSTITPPTPVIVTPPTTHTPSLPTPTIPSPPFIPVDPGHFPGTCNYWKNHPTLVWGVLGWWGTVGNAFGVSSIPGFGSHMSLLDALSNKRTDGIGALYREGTASWLNSMVDKRFPYSTQQVRNSFGTALHSEKVATAQAQLFKLANEGQFN
ncbi:hypothetical protein ACFE04_007741 [Oxalis oulophora]